jgi:hypothetical protein
VFLLRVRSVLRRNDPTAYTWILGVSAMMTEMGYPGLARLIGRPEGAGDQIIVSNMQVAVRRRAAAAMSTAMMKGDVEGVLAALRLLGVRAAIH